MTAHDDVGPGDDLFTWAVLAPVLVKHFSIVSSSESTTSVRCACSPTTPRTLEQWARHVSQEVTNSVA